MELGPSAASLVPSSSPQLSIRHLKGTSRACQLSASLLPSVAAAAATMVMPLPSHLRLPSPTGSSDAHHPRSPVKKHLRGQGSTSKPATAKLGSPQKLKATVASQSDVTSAPTASMPAPGSRLRAATLQAVLGLVDRDDAALEQLLPMLHALASLPLDNAAVRRACGAFLQQQLTQVASVVDTPVAIGGRVSRAPLAVIHGASALASRNSGRAKSGVSLRHCKDFLLACANEIHELEEVSPWFDYAEETSSDLAAEWPRRRELAPAFDYVSLADAASSVLTGRVADETAEDVDDDARADTGSQLSELLLRTVEAEKADREATAAVFHAWRQQAAAPRQRQATLQRAFAALKRHRAGSALSRERKQRAFGRLKALVATAPPVAARRVVAPPSTAARVVARLLLHWDLVVLLAVACFVQLARLA